MGHRQPAIEPGVPVLHLFREIKEQGYTGGLDIHTG
jgi:hypothetical protein